MENRLRSLNTLEDSDVIPSRKWMHSIAGLLLAPACLVAAAPLRAAEPQQWAVLIGVERHDESRLNLKYTENDVQRLRQVLVERAGLSSDRILQLTDGTADRQPTLANLYRELPAFLRKPGPDDRVLVFFSGHGFLYKDRTYLVPRDFMATDPAATALPLTELRRALGECQARIKFLVLDCCHAGNDKAVESSPASETVAKAVEVERVPGCVVLASCRAAEKSLEWAERKQGVFTYWLCRGLEGGAADDNGRVTLAALNTYVHERVTRTAQLLERAQTPVQFGNVEGGPVMLALRPEAPESLCRRLAEHIDLEARARGLKRVGVVEFVQPRGRTEGLASANLPGYCAEQVRLALRGLGAGSYGVLDSDAMQEAAKGLTVEVVGDPQAMRRLGEQGGLDAVVCGELRRRGQNLVVTCELVSTADDSSLVKPSGVLRLTEEIIADSSSLSFSNHGRPPGRPHDSNVLTHVEGQAAVGHPLLDPGWPFRVELYTVQARRGEQITDATPRKKKEFVQREVEAYGPDGKKKKRKELLVAARDGEIFEIHLANKSEERVAMHLLVDGLNTLGKKRERLGQGPPWILDPKKEYRVPGWTLPPEKPGGLDRIRRFQFRNVSKSVLGRQDFSEAVGLITAAFYAEYEPPKFLEDLVKKEGPVTAKEKLMVDEGPEERRMLETTTFRAGRLLGVVQIRYVDERELNK
jgi:hypothetical protein